MAATLSQLALDRRRCFAGASEIGGVLEKGERAMKKIVLPGRLGQILLAVYLLLVGLGAVIGLHFTFMFLLQGILALAAGVLLLLGR
jgi:hypothetical protein